MPRPKSVDLTGRQTEVLRLIAGGKSNAEIAEILGISLDGAKYHVSEILSKLGVGSREEAAGCWHRQQALRPRFSRAMRAFLSAPTLWKLAGGVAAVTAAAAVVAVVTVMRDSVQDADQGPSPESEVLMAATATPGGLVTVPESCPAQASAIATRAFRPALGEGPVYMVPGPGATTGQRVLAYHPADWQQNFPAGWGGQDVTFLVAPSYQQPITISGGGFGTSDELQFVGPPETVLLDMKNNPGTGFPVMSITADGWRSYIATVLFRLDSPGCYFLEFKAPGLSERIVFWAAVGAPRPSATPAPSSPTPTPPACGFDGPVRPIIEWMPYLRLLGRSYLAIGVGFAAGPNPPLSIDPALAGRQVGTVLWSVRDPATNPCYSQLDGSSAALPAGTPVFALKGYREDFRLVAETPFGWRIFESDGLNGAKVVGDALDIRGKVLAIAGERTDASGATAHLGEVSDPATVARLVDLVLAQPITFTGNATHPGRNDPPTVQLTFQLSDGTSTVRSFYIGGWEMSQGYAVTAGFFAQLETYFAAAR